MGAFPVLRSYTTPVFTALARPPMCIVLPNHRFITPAINR